jgi:hypothetical protein
VTRENLARRPGEQIARQSQHRNTSNLRINPAEARERRRQAENNHHEELTRAQFIRKKREYEKKLSQGVNISQLNTEQMRLVKTGVSNLFKHEINPMTVKR